MTSSVLPDDDDDAAKAGLGQNSKEDLGLNLLGAGRANPEVENDYDNIGYGYCTENICDCPGLREGF